MIDQTTAIDIARKRAEKNNWAFAEPIDIIERKDWRGKLAKFTIETNAHNRGNKARFSIDAQSGKIISEGYLPR